MCTAVDRDSKLFWSVFLFWYYSDRLTLLSLLINAYGDALWLVYSIGAGGISAVDQGLNLKEFLCWAARRLSSSYIGMEACNACILTVQRTNQLPLLVRDSMYALHNAFHRRRVNGFRLGFEAHSDCARRR